MRGVSAISTILFIVIFAGGYGIEYVSYGHNIQGLWVLGIAFLIALYVSSSLKIADQWDRAVVLRLGNFHALKGSGLFFRLLTSKTNRNMLFCYEIQ